MGESFNTCSNDDTSNPNQGWLACYPVLRTISWVFLAIVILVVVVLLLGFTRAIFRDQSSSFRWELDHILPGR